MKWRRDILPILFFLCFTCVGRAEGLPVQDQDSLAYFAKDSLLLKTISVDTHTFEQFKNDRLYNYYEAKIREKSIFERMRDDFINWFNRTLNKSLSSKEADLIFFLLGLLLTAIVVFIVYRVNPALFYINKRSKLLYSVEEEDIEGTDFDKLIRNALQQKEYGEAVRWQYTKTLKILNSAEIISWDPNKTVNEYVYEVKRPDIRNRFRDLSRQFTYFRYGNGVAGEESFEAVKKESEEIERSVNRPHSATEMKEKPVVTL